MANDKFYSRFGFFKASSSDIQNQIKGYASRINAYIKELEDFIKKIPFEASCSGESVKGKDKKIPYERALAAEGNGKAEYDDLIDDDDYKNFLKKKVDWDTYRNILVEMSLIVIELDAFCEKQKDENKKIIGYGCQGALSLDKSFYEGKLDKFEGECKNKVAAIEEKCLAEISKVRMKYDAEKVRVRQEYDSNEKSCKEELEKVEKAIENQKSELQKIRNKFNSLKSELVCQQVRDYQKELIKSDKRWEWD